MPVSCHCWTFKKNVYAVGVWCVHSRCATESKALTTAAKTAAARLGAGKTVQHKVQAATPYTCSTLHINQIGSLDLAACKCSLVSVHLLVLPFFVCQSCGHLWIIMSAAWTGLPCPAVVCQHPLLYSADQAVCHHSCMRPWHWCLACTYGSTMLM